MKKYPVLIILLLSLAIGSAQAKKRGDFNDDGKVNILDLISFLGHLSGKNPIEDAEDEYVLVSEWGTGGNLVRGGLMYDKWWKINGATEPASDNPSYVGSQTGSSTWRCKECHGWDYKGMDGAYGTGSSHYTGYKGIFEASSNQSQQELVDLLRNGTTGSTGNKNGYDTDQLSDQDIADIVAFIQYGLIDLSLYIDYSTKETIDPDITNGQSKYEATCVSCHGVDGKAISGLILGDVATGNPWEFIHKVRFGQPGTSMPSSIIEGWSTNDVRDVLDYSQTLPVE